MSGLPEIGDWVVVTGPAGAKVLGRVCMLDRFDPEQPLAVCPELPWDPTKGVTLRDDRDHLDLPPWAVGQTFTWARTGWRLATPEELAACQLTQLSSL